MEKSKCRVTLFGTGTVMNIVACQTFLHRFIWVVFYQGFDLYDGHKQPQAVFIKLLVRELAGAFKNRINIRFSGIGFLRKFASLYLS